MSIFQQPRFRAALLAFSLAGAAGWLTDDHAQSQAPAQSGIAATTEEWRIFHDKEGHEVEARIVALSADCRSIRIARRDGTPIDLPITRLSLDDQQYLREWFFARPPADPATLRFRLTANRHERPQTKERLNSSIQTATWETSELSYDISVVNLSSGPVPNLKLEYCILLENVIDVSTPGEGDADDDAGPMWRVNRSANVRYHQGSVDLPLLMFNRPHAVETDALVRDLVKTQRLTREETEDRPVGIILRLIDSSGRVVASHRELTREHAELDWDAFVARRDPAEKAGAGFLVEAVAAN